MLSQDRHSILWQLGGWQNPWKRSEHQQEFRHCPNIQNGTSRSRNDKSIEGLLKANTCDCRRKTDSNPKNNTWLENWTSFWKEKKSYLETRASAFLKLHLQAIKPSSWMDPLFQVVPVIEMPHLAVSYMTKLVWQGIYVRNLKTYLPHTELIQYPRGYSKLILHYLSNLILVDCETKIKLEVDPTAEWICTAHFRPSFFSWVTV